MCLRATYCCAAAAGTAADVCSNACLLGKTAAPGAASSSLFSSQGKLTARQARRARGSVVQALAPGSFHDGRFHQHAAGAPKALPNSSCWARAPTRRKSPRREVSRLCASGRQLAPQATGGRTDAGRERDAACVLCCEGPNGGKGFRRPVRGSEVARAHLGLCLRGAGVLPGRRRPPPPRARVRICGSRQRNTNRATQALMPGGWTDARMDCPSTPSLLHAWPKGRPRGRDCGRAGGAACCVLRPSSQQDIA